MIVNTRKTYKYRVYPAKSQVSNLENQFSMCRHLYNWCLAERKEAYENNGETISYNAQQNSLPELKKERPWFKSVYSQVLQDVLRRLDKGYQAFFRRVKDGEEPGYPKFKKRGQWTSITYPQYHDRPCGNIYVPKVGNIKVVCHRDIPEDAKVKTLTISKEGGKWFACFSVELPFDIEPKQDLPPIGIDMGLIDFVYTSDGYHAQAPKYYRKIQKRLAKLQRRMAETEKGSPKWYKLLKAVQKTHYKIKCQRHDFLHKETNRILEGSDTIFHEDLKIRNMSRRPAPKPDDTGRFQPNGAGHKAGLNKSIMDAGWHQFLCILKYKAIEQGKQVVPVPSHNTSQMCSNCGEIVKKSLSVRTHRCPSCGFAANRDLNAALNILGIGLDTLAAQAA